MSDAQWRQLTETCTQRLTDGRLMPHCGSALVIPFARHDDYRPWDNRDTLNLSVLACAANSVISYRPNHRADSPA